MSEIESITFDKGLINKRSPLLLEDGELVTAQGMTFSTAGTIQARPSKLKASTTAIGSINGLHRNMNTVIATDAANVRMKWDLTGFCGLYTPSNDDFTLIGELVSTNRPVMRDLEDMTFLVTGNDKKVIINGLLSEWDIPAPTNAPSGATGSSGNPSGTYSLYYTYLIHFPNGRVVETAPSPAGSVTVVAQKIEWRKINTCPYSGTGLVIHRKLYRYSTTIIETYYVTTITDNTTTTYSDNYTDAQLEINDILGTSDYSVPPEDPTCLEVHLQRIFAAAGSFVYASEPYLPFNFTYTNILQITQTGDDITALVKWGDQLFIPTTSTWYRLHGSSADTWTVKSTFAHNGVINKHTVIATRYGIFGLWYNGIYLFDGNISKNLTLPKIAESVFENISSIKSCYAEWDGKKYYFHYPESGTTISKRMVIDMTYYPDPVICYEDFIPTAHHYHNVTGTNYYGYGGYHYKDGGTDTVSLSLQTGDKACKNILKEKQLEYLYYDINTSGKDVVVTIYMDDVSIFTKTINTSARTKERLLLPSKQGYRFSVSITAVNGRGVVIYEPWAVSVNMTGV